MTMKIKTNDLNMETEEKVFHSEISRVDCEEKNHLYDLLKIEPAKPVLCPPVSKKEVWEFHPNYEKHYSPKRVQSKLKVETVRDVRALFENNEYSHLDKDLEIQQNYLLRKICDGSSSEEKTKKTAIKLLISDNPISRTSWQMISNINPHRHKHSKQFVLWNGICIQVNGSKGGKNKFICKFDLKAEANKSLKNASKFKKTTFKTKMGLLRNSLNVKFKPGPLGKKILLDTSHHRYQMGNIEVVKLPSPVLEVSPTYGMVLEPAISSFVNNLRGEKGVISQKLAEFAVSVLGKAHNNTAEQIQENSCVTFTLNYKCEQNRILMRRNEVDAKSHENTVNLSNNNNCQGKFIQESAEVGNNMHINTKISNSSEENTDESVNNDNTCEIKQIMNEILDSVSISLNQDCMFSKNDELRDTVEDVVKVCTASKDKSRRKYCELDKLDVTIIKIPEASSKDYTKPCGKSFCTMGCVCESLDCVFSLKQHCGIIDCMFGCKCEISKFKNIDLLDQDDIHGLLNLDNEINSHLAKEEQKFHQTVIFSGEKSILLQSRKRNWKSTKKYSEFYSKMNLKGDDKSKKTLSIHVEKLNCEAIEPFCMVHNLYKCFCKGKFVETYMRNDTTGSNTNKSLNNEGTDTNPDISRSVLRPRLKNTYEYNRNDIRKYSFNTDDDDEVSKRCARTIGYSGRKYTDDYYFATNKKIEEMEEDDNLLKTKMLRLMSVDRSPSPSESVDCEIISCTSQTTDPVLSRNNENEGKNQAITIKQSDENCEAISNVTESKKEDQNFAFVKAEGKYSLKHWLESSYKSYKERRAKGTIKNVLEAPKKGKISLQCWDFILSRYRERRNIFFVSKKEPFRTFLAKDLNHPWFANCINIDDIRFADLPKYPIIIKNLVTNSTDSENCFCILRGWDHCWELIGSAVKVIEKSAESIYSSDDGDSECTLTDQITSSEKSKWFVLSVENDFTEIQFYKKGFFVTYEGIQRSINLARISGKTVRLSARARTDRTQNTKHPFGIYAIPCIMQSCVFIGPYEDNEPLGIELVKSVSASMRLRKTRGVWIKTNKVDNENVIDNPLAYLPSSSISNENISMQIGFSDDGNSTSPALVEQLENSNTTTPEKEERISVSTPEKEERILISTPEKEERISTSTPEKEESISISTPEKDDRMSKQIKPIKIRRTNGFYQLLPKSVLQKLSKSDLFVSKNSDVKEPISINTDDIKESQTSSILKPVANTPTANIEVEPRASTSAVTKPIAEIAPQIKITNVYFANKQSASSKGPTMLVLKPEEINNKILGNSAMNDDISKDIETFLETSTICIAPQEDVMVISDGEDDAVTSIKDAWIQCANVANFGYIRAKINDENKAVSFEFPGFKYSEFYEESEAFDKINQVVARKMYIPRNVKLLWEVIWDKRHLNCDILSPKCLEDKRYLINKLREQRDNKRSIIQAFTSTMKRPAGAETRVVTYETPKTKKMTYLNKKKSTVTTSGPADTANTKNEQMKLMEDLEEASRKLEEQGAVLWNEAVTRRDEILDSLSLPDTLKLGMTEALQGMMSFNKQ